MNIKRNLLVCFLSFSFILMMSFFVSFYKYQEKDLDQEILAKGRRDRRERPPRPVRPPISLPGDDEEMGSDRPGTVENRCGLVLVERRGRSRRTYTYQHRCAPLGKIYKCSPDHIFVEDNPKKGYVKGGRIYEYRERRGKPDPGKSEHEIKQLTCEETPIEMASNQVYSMPKELKEERKCGLVPYGREDFAVQHQCASKGKMFSCEYKTIYISPKVPGNYSTKPVSTYKEESQDWVCDREEIPGKKKLKFKKKLKKRRRK